MATLVLFFPNVVESRDQDGGSVRLDKMAAQCVVTEKALVRPFTLDTAQYRPRRQGNAQMKKNKKRENMRIRLVSTLQTEQMKFN
jgi:hypothetical protein